jgi:nitrite reductase/ring-hydroxylating ferredoxin subunit
MPDTGGAGQTQRLRLCRSEDLSERGQAVDFQVRFGLEVQSAFALRFEGRVHAYLNRCAHVPMELDFQRNRFFDASGQWLICATHGALYEPDTGRCRGGPCRGGLFKIELSEVDSQVYWHTSALIQPLSAPP